MVSRCENTRVGKISQIRTVDGVFFTSVRSLAANHQPAAGKGKIQFKAKTRKKERWHFLMEDFCNRFHPETESSLLVCVQKCAERRRLEFCWRSFRIGSQKSPSLTFTKFSWILKTSNVYNECRLVQRHSFRMTKHLLGCDFWVVHVFNLLSGCLDCVHENLDHFREFNNRKRKFNYRKLAASVVRDDLVCKYSSEALAVT